MASCGSFAAWFGKTSILEGLFLVSWNFRAYGMIDDDPTLELRCGFLDFSFLVIWKSFPLSRVKIVLFGLSWDFF